MRAVSSIFLGLVILLNLTLAMSAQAQPATPCNPCVAYCTYTNGGWGAPPQGHNAGWLLQHYFNTVYPAGVTIGGTYSIQFTNAVAITDFLPQTNPPAVLTQSYVDPSADISVLAGQVLALQLNIDFGDAGINGMVDIGSLVIATGPFAGWTLDALLSLANTVLGGDVTALPPGVSLGDLTAALNAANYNFDNCYDNDGYIVIPSQGATTVIRYPDVTDPIGDDLPLSVCLTFTPQCEDICLIWWCNGCSPTDFANFSVVPGCSGPDCVEECAPNPGFLTGLDWGSQQLLESIPGDGCWWYATAHATEPGCFCVTLDFQLPVDLAGFDAIPGNGEVRLAWTTSSETDHDYFEIQRDHVPVQRLDGQGSSASGASYTWTDAGLTNGHRYSYTLMSVDAAGTSHWLASDAATPEAPAVVTEYALYQNYPNPFNPSTSIRFDVAAAGHVNLTVFDIAGHTLATLVDREMPASSYTVSFDASALASGTYFYRLESPGFKATRKMLLLK